VTITLAERGARGARSARLTKQAARQATKDAATALATSTISSDDPRVLLSLDDLRAMGIVASRNQLRQMEKEGRFPRAMKIHSSNAWVRTQIVAYLDALIKEQQAG
jgi:predicted DNA-binding transcriptional regulator AlpA